MQDGIDDAAQPISRGRPSRQRDGIDCSIGAHSPSLMLLE
jgi:hypothetical protein